MSIIDKGSVFIVGAGCSAPFGVPVGGSLIDDLAKQLETEFEASIADHKSGITFPFPNGVRIARQNNVRFDIFPISASVLQYETSKRNGNNGLSNEAIAQLRELSTLLSGQTSETIDDFIVENPEYAYLCKVGVAWAIFDKLYSFTKSANHFKRKDVSARYLDGKNKKGEEVKIRNWIHLLINIVRHGLRDGENNVKTPDNKVRIISFNYDPILETVLKEQFQNTQSGYKHYSEYIEIAHPHGVFDDLPVEIIDPAERICLWADKIHVVNEPDEGLPQHIKDTQKKAADWMMQATKVYAAGFAFSKPNCDLLKLQQKPQPQPDYGINKHYVSYCNYSGSAGLREIVKRRVGDKDIFEKSLHNEQAGSAESPLSIEEWIRGGFLGEMPG